MYQIFIFLFLNYFLLINGVPQRCQELSISANDNANSLNTSVSLIVQVSESNGKNMITINNFTRTFQQSARDNTFQPFGKTSLENTNITVCILNQCFTNFIKSVSAIIDNGVFDVRVNWNLFSKDYSYTLFNGIVDQRNLIFFDGSLFSDNRQCMEYNDIDYLPSLKTCCTSFQAVPQISSPSTKCSNFKAVSSIFDTKTNNLIATNYANFVLSDYDITATWHYVLDPRFSHVFAINDVNCQKAPNGIQYCNYFIGGQNKEFLIQDSFIEEFIGGPNILIGRIILRNSQTLMEEGIQFSPSNQCQSFNGIANLQTANVTFKIINQFCCSDFDAPTTPSPIPSSTSPTTPPPTKLISQQCNQISTVSIDNNSAKVSTTMQIKSINNDKNEIYISDIDIKTSMNISNVSIYVYNFMELVLECQNVSFNSANFTVDNKMIKIVISYLSQSGGLYTMDIFKGIIDQGNFISINGIMYDKNDNKCFKSSTFSTNTIFCCTLLNQNSQIPPYNPKCTNFQISSKFYNSTTKSIYASATSDFTLTNSDIIAKGNYVGEIPLLYSFNNYIFQRGVNKTQFGGFPIQNTNMEFFIQIQYYTATKTSIFVGRIILLDGQTFLEPDISLTTSNNCLNISSPYQDATGQNGINIVNELCCIAFAAGNNIVTTTTTTTLLSSTNPSSATSIISSPALSSTLASTNPGTISSTISSMPTSSHPFSSSTIFISSSASPSFEITLFFVIFFELFLLL